MSINSPQYSGATLTVLIPSLKNFVPNTALLIFAL